MATAVSFYGLTVNDNTLKSNGEPESASMQVAVVTLTAANVVAQTALLATLYSAIDAVSIGVIAKEELTFNRHIISVARASSTLAQRENKFLVRYHSATTRKKFRVGIPAADLSLLTDGSEFLDIAAAGVGLDLKNAFEAVVRNPDDPTEAVIVDSIQFVGRNT